MASQKYFCYKCRDNGWPTEEVVFSGKDEKGKTILKNPDNSLHQHKQQKQSQQQQQQQQQQDPSLEWSGLTHTELVEKVLKERGITEILDKLIGLETKIDRLLNLVYAQSQQQHDQDFQRDRNLLDNR